MLQYGHRTKKEVNRLCVVMLMVISATHAFAQLPVKAQRLFVQSVRNLPRSISRRDAGIWQRRFWGEVRPENRPVDGFQHRTGVAPAAKPTISATSRIMPRMCGIAGATR